jgi:hypothetical protein
MKIRRTRFYIKPLIQKRVGLFTGSLSVMGGVIGIACLSFLPTLINAFSHQRTFIPGQGLDTLLYSLPWVILLLGLIFSLSVLVGVYYSHRIVGPILKMENAITRRLNGAKNPAFQLRKSDLTVKLADLLNELFKRQVLIDDAADRLVEELDLVLEQLDCRICANDSTQAMGIETTGLLNHLNEFKAVLHHRSQKEHVLADRTVETDAMPREVQC